MPGALVGKITPAALEVELIDHNTHHDFVYKQHCRFALVSESVITGSFIEHLWSECSKAPKETNHGVAGPSQQKETPVDQRRDTHHH